MLIKLINIKENPDGSADVDVKYDKEGMKLLIERGVISILEDYIKQEKGGHEPQSERRKTTPAFIQPNKRYNTKGWSNSIL